MKKILFSPKAQDGGSVKSTTAAESTLRQDLAVKLGLPADASEEEVIAHVAALKGRLDLLEAERKRVSDEELVIQGKMKAGLSRAQAEAVIRNQKQWDEAKAKRQRQVQAFVDSLPEGEDIPSAVRNKFTGATSEEIRTKRTPKTQPAA